MGRIFCVESKSFEFVLDSGGNSLCLKIIERGLGSVPSVRLGHEGIFWLLSTIEEMASANSKTVRASFGKSEPHATSSFVKEATTFMGLIWPSRNLVEEGGGGLFYSLKAEREVGLVWLWEGASFGVGTIPHRETATSDISWRSLRWQARLSDSSGC
jgi:hypothetical protein